MNRLTFRPRWIAMTCLAAAAVLAATACDGEDRPGVTEIPGTPGATGSVSVSVSGPGPASTPSAGDEIYKPVSDVAGYENVGLDLRDMATLMAPATAGGAVDWKAVTAIYAEGRNSRSGTGLRTLKALATSKEVLQEFPGRTEGESSLDANMRAGLEGTGRGQGLSDNARRQLVAKGAQAIVYGKALQELTAARVKVQAGNKDNAMGAPHNVDEAWGLYAGARDPAGARPYSLSATARSREANFNLAGRLDKPLLEALKVALQEAQEGDLAEFDRAVASVRGHMNAIFYLATLRYANEATKATDPAARQAVLAEGWAFYQSIRPAVQSASPSAATAVETIYTRAPATAMPATAVTDVYSALNSEPVLKALGIPATLVVRTPP